MNRGNKPPVPQAPGEKILDRRGFLALGMGVMLAGCGFQPVYMPTASGQPGPAQRELAAIDVALMPDRPGMLLRQALQDRFEGTGDVVPRRYSLTVSFGAVGSAIGVEQDSIVTRLRMTGIATWTLTADDPGHTLVTRGSAHALDALNEIDSQLFASDLEIEVVEKRLADALADQITMQLATFFRKRAATAAAG